MTEQRTPYTDRAGVAFDEAPHTYTHAGERLPSVTEILGEVLRPSYYGATEWHMERGRIVHQCAAMLCRGERFEHDPQIDGQVQACRAWLAARNPDIMAVELRVARLTGGVRYAGTLDLLATMQGRLCIVDWKATDAPQYRWQLAAYADALADDGLAVRDGLTVELGADGKWKEGERVDIKSAIAEWRNILNVYGLKRREGMIK
jgi:hypothetical protein